MERKNKGMKSRRMIKQNEIGKKINTDQNKRKSYPDESVERFKGNSAHLWVAVLQMGQAHS